MTHSQAKAIFVEGALISSLFFLALAYDSHMKYAQKTHEDKLTAQAISGKWVRKSTTAAAVTPLWAQVATIRLTLPKSWDNGILNGWCSS